MMRAMGFFASPRRRRRLAWAALALGLVGLAFGVNALLPSHGPPKHVRVAPQAPVLGGTPAVPPTFEDETPAAKRARERAEATVHPLANAFVGDLLRRRHLREAYALLAPPLRSHYSLATWQRGRDLPLAANPTATPGSSVAFSGGTTVGLVATIAPSSAGSDSTLFAIRFDKANGRWLVDYARAGHGTTRIDETNFSPPGFLPGSHTETLRTWLILAGGLLGLILVAALVSRGLRGPALG
jgi:hypothetical protein